MYGLTEIQLMNNAAAALATWSIAPPSAGIHPANMRWSGYGFECQSISQQIGVDEALDQRLNTPITEGEWQARKAGR